MDSAKVFKIVDEYTICLYAIMDSTYSGEFEDVKFLHNMLLKKRHILVNNIREPLFRACADLVNISQILDRTHIFMLMLLVVVGIFYYLIIFQYHYVGKYRNNNYISYLSIVSLN